MAEAELVPILRAYHPLYAATPTAALLRIDHEWAHGNFRDWAKFLEAAYGNRQGCIAARKPGALADQATVLARKPGPGNSTIVTVKPEGGVFAGQTLKVTIVMSGEVWKIDKISGDAKVGP